MQKIPMTVLGAEILKKELDELKVRRPKIIQAIAEAREHGDLKENAEYHAARNEQGLLEARIKEIEAKLSAAQVIDISLLTNEGKVIFGATVKIQNLEDNQVSTYQIVGEDEADLKLNKISVTSPVAKSLIGKREGDEVEVHTPSGKVYYEIQLVEYKA